MQESLPVVAADGGAAARNDGESRLFVDLEPVPAISKRHGHGDADGGGGDAAPYARTVSNSFKEAPRIAERLPLSSPVHLAESTGFAWAKKPRPDSTAAATVTKRSGSKRAGDNNNAGGHAARTAAAATTAAAPYKVEKQEIIKQ